VHRDIHQRERRSLQHEVYGAVAVLAPLKLLIRHGANALMSTDAVSVDIRDGIENIRECRILDLTSIPVGISTSLKFPLP